MARTKVRINSAGARSILISGAVSAELDRRGQAIARAANGMASADTLRNQPFSANTRNGMNRARCIVGTASPHGINHNNKYNTLLKALGAGR